MFVIISLIEVRGQEDKEDWMKEGEENDKITYILVLGAATMQNNVEFP